MPRHDLDHLEIQLVSTLEGCQVLCLKGFVTAKNTPALQDAIQQVRGQDTILDLTEVPYMDSSGLGALLNGYVGSQKHGGQFALAGVAPRVRELLQITKIEPLFRIYRTVEEAARALVKNPKA